MARKKKEIALWTVRTAKSGHYIGCFYAYSAEQAISKQVAAECQVASTFRKSHGRVTPTSEYTASVEPRSE
jgi:hypothetical protein